MKNEKSFTLIELLVVIAIIGLLASLVLVSTRGLQQKAKITKTLEFSQSLNNSLGAYAVGRWDFDESSGTQAKDSSGYGYNGTINGGTTYDGNTPHAAIGRGTGKWALNFNGSSGYLYLPGNTNTSLQNNINTVAMWAYVRSLNPGGNTYGELYAVSGGAGTTGIKWQTSAIGLIVNGDFYNYYVPVSLSFNTWNHIVVEINRTTRIAKVYLDGAYKGQTGPWPVYTPQANTVQIARNSMTGNPNDYLNGIIDEVVIYNVALSGAEIKKQYAEGLERHQNLVIK